MSGLLRRLVRAAVRERALVVVTLAAAIVRVYWNLRVHPPTRYGVSDMSGYLDRATEMFDDARRAHTWFGANWQPRPHTTVFPWGTHAFVFCVKLLFGRDARAPVDVAFALLGSAGVAFAHATARRLWPRRRTVTLAIGALLVVYYPWISLSGYALSEPGLCACLGAVTLFSLRLADRGRAGDAWALGAAAGLGAVFRPQMLLSVALLLAVFVVRRRAFPRVRRRFALYIAAPIAVCLAVSSARIAFHNGRLGLVSTNGPVNYVFGRCHAPALETHVRGSVGGFGPPPFGAMLEYEKRHPGALFKLDPVTPKVTIEGYMWDREAFDRVARDCIEKTGWAKQARFAATHVAMLWGYNAVWPDVADARFRRRMSRWSTAVWRLQPVPLLLGLGLALRRRRARDLLLAAHALALVGTAVVYFGDTRLRVPYDGIFWTLGLGAAASATGALWSWLRALRDRAG